MRKVDETRNNGIKVHLFGFGRGGNKETVPEERPGSVRRPRCSLKEVKSSTENELENVVVPTDNL